MISMVEFRSLSVSKGPVPLNDTWHEIGKERKYTWLKVLMITEIDYLHLSFSKKINVQVLSDKWEIKTSQHFFEFLNSIVILK